jgi:hypothetical protein
MNIPHFAQIGLTSLSKAVGICARIGYTVRNE